MYRFDQGHGRNGGVEEGNTVVDSSGNVYVVGSGGEIVKEEKAWFKITELAFSFKEHTAIQEKLVCDLSSSNEIPSSIIFFLKNYCSNEVLAKAIQKCEEMESLYKTFDICNGDDILSIFNSSKDTP